MPPSTTERATHVPEAVPVDKDAPALRPRGRPRNDACNIAIEAATLDLLVEVGYAGISLERVAARAGVGKATIYRRWDSKLDLVVDAVIGRCEEHVVSPDTGSLRGDLLALYGALLAKFRRDGEVMHAFVSEQRRYPELAEAFRRMFLDARRAATRAVLARGVERGELPASSDLELLGDLGSAILWQRLSVSGAPLDDDLPERIINQFFPTAR